MIVGLVVNPVAGIGGPAALKGSDGPHVQRRAWERGAVPRAGQRSATAVRALRKHRPGVAIMTVPGAMGADCAPGARVVEFPGAAAAGEPTTAAHTRAAVAALRGVDLLMFAGGDGTARDVLDAEPDSPVLGIPAGVKVYSGCFAISPAAAGLIAASYLDDPGLVRDAEVVDLDEDAYRAGDGTVGQRLYGTLPVPYQPARLSGRKASTPPGTTEGIARECVARMAKGVRYVLGPGTTTRAVGRELGLRTSLLGVDVVLDGRLVGTDVTEAELYALVRDGPAQALLSIIGGQGFVLGRGNQQLSLRVLGELEAITVLGTQQKLAALGGRPLLADTGDPRMDAALAGYVTVITDFRQTTIYRLSSASEGI
ncbi:ATP-NAD kinase family protein [Dactylosporangium roseum]|uniref:ATP-NAD kinase family protein n=1 Tax=Dactylosporangium roseum TaxID=47989 RepID=UPI0021B17C10|nr:NAD(+)/NADH kinase [Dactylosporangium roseum]